MVTKKLHLLIAAFASAICVTGCLGETSTPTKPGLRGVSVKESIAQEKQKPVTDATLEADEEDDDWEEISEAEQETRNAQNAWRKIKRD